MRGVIVTADDFGVAPEVNLAVEQAFCEGVLTAASLMVGAPAAADAVARARAMPGLGVGLHVVLVEGKPVLPAEEIPALVGRDGQFHPSMIRTAFLIALSRKARAQMRAEIAAQFAAFAQTGLPLDHVNAHKHFHLHPMIAGAIIEIGRGYGMKAVRVPLEQGTSGLMRWWTARLARRLRKAGILVNDTVAGLSWSGAFDSARMQSAMARIGDGLTEIYCHPATDDHFAGAVPGYQYRAELAALMHGGVREALVESGARLGKFADFANDGQAISSC